MAFTAFFTIISLIITIAGTILGLTVLVLAIACMIKYLRS